LLFMKEMKQKKWSFEEPTAPTQKAAFEGNFFDTLKDYLQFSRDLDGYVRILADVNEQILPFYNDMDEWIESILIDNAKVMECSASATTLECQLNEFAQKIRKMNYDLLKEFALQENLLLSVQERPVLVVEDSQKCKLMLKRLEPFKNSDGKLDIDGWRTLAYPFSDENTVETMPKVIEGYQRLMIDAKENSFKAMNLLENVSRYINRCKKNCNQQEEDDGTITKKPHLDEGADERPSAPPLPPPPPPPPVPTAPPTAPTPAPSTEMATADEGL
jgi:hypothetical protein